MARSYYVDGEKLKTLRTKGGWEDDIDGFALDAGVHPETVKRAEKNGKMFKRKIEAFARVLRVDWKDLIAPPNVQSGLIVIEIEVDADADAFKKAYTLSSIIREFEEHVWLRHDIKGISIRYSSVVIRLWCHTDDAPRFVSHLNRGYFPFPLRSVTFAMKDILQTGEFVRVRNFSGGIGDGPWEVRFHDHSGHVAVADMARSNEMIPDSEYLSFVTAGWFYCVILIVELETDDLTLTITKDKAVVSLRDKKTSRSRSLIPS